MKINRSKIGKFGPFEVVATENRRIIQQFVDAETGLLIVREVENVVIQGNHSKPTFVTTIDLNRALVERLRLGMGEDRSGVEAIEQL